VLTAPEICDALGDRFGLLTGGARNALPRQRTLHASVEWSYDLLSEAERTLLRRLSVFAGATTLDAVERICDGQGLQRPHILGLLIGLVDKSLVMVYSDVVVTRYRLLETVRQYADARLIESGEKH
jgi:predicted ATPase